MNYEFKVGEIKAKWTVLPSIFLELSQLTSGYEASIEFIEESLIYEPLTAVRILRIANSPFYNAGKTRIVELKSAILKIGLDQIHEIILRLRVHRLFECKKGTVSIENLLKHSLGVACLSKKIAEFIKFEKKWAKVAFSLGLLHDIGKIGRYRIDEIEDSSTLERDSRFAVKESISLIEVERLNNSPLHDYLGYIICKSCG